MENNRGQSIFLSVVGIATLLVAIVGATFAYFSISVSGNETAQSVQVTTAKLGGVTFDATGAGVNITNVYPGWTVTKQFTVTSDADATDASIDYIVNLVVATPGSGETLLQGSDFVYTLSATTATGTSTATGTETQMPSTGTNQLCTGHLSGASDLHTYTLTITFKETGSDQNTQQGKVYNAVVQIQTASNSGLRTWDNNASTWTTYTGA